MLKGAGLGAVGGAAFGAIGFPNNPWKVAAYGVTGGGLSMLAGGEFGDGFLTAGSLALMGYGYYKFMDGRIPTGARSSGDAIEKPTDGTKATQAMNTNSGSPCFGNAQTNKNLPTWNSSFSENSLKWIPNNIPITQDGCFCHDFLGYKIFTDRLSWMIAKYPSMVPAAVWTTGGVATYYAPLTSAIISGTDDY